MGARGLAPFPSTGRDYDARGVPILNETLATNENARVDIGTMFHRKFSLNFRFFPLQIRPIIY